MIKLVVFLLAAAAATISLAAAPEKRFSLTIINDALPSEQQLVKVNKDDTVRLLVTSNQPGNLHVHGYHLEMKLVPGKPSEIEFQAYATGRYPFEWHGADKSKAAKRPGTEFAVLEVYPN